MSYRSQKEKKNHFFSDQQQPFPPFSRLFFHIPLPPKLTARAQRANITAGGHYAFTAQFRDCGVGDFNVLAGGHNAVAAIASTRDIFHRNVVAIRDINAFASPFNKVDSHTLGMSQAIWHHFFQSRN